MERGGSFAFRKAKKKREGIEREGGEKRVRNETCLFKVLKKKLNLHCLFFSSLLSSLSPSLSLSPLRSFYKSNCKKKNRCGRSIKKKNEWT